MDADAILDRRRLKRNLIVWRGVAVVAVIGAVFLGFWRGDRLIARDHVVRLAVEGLIVDDAERLEALNRIAKDERAKALIVRIDSPGGTTVGGEALYHGLRRVADKKPVVATIRTLGTSAGYLAALAGHRIIARESSLTGSIGVLVQTAEMSGMLEKLGVSAEVIRSAPLKGKPSPLAPLSEEGRQATQEVVDDVHQWFVGIVAERRKLAPEQAQALAQGRVYSGRQALKLGLIDELGGEIEARAWLRKAHKLSTSLPVRPVELSDEGLGLFRLITGLAEKMSLSERLTLDGLVSVWHPEGLF
ncbi:MAG: signal peptide peptidase SppA [Alphaproteobacteria bacterium]|nr:signal peptide peptidase SppA [Rhodospirillaceae bacterium]MDP6404270.1 signal peptide peptidase SppA [Alphaproteobacteria bacterium]MDP6621902.1 signal peptide peptidase SppA [Alphaproteobacteria bacterium]